MGVLMGAMDVLDSQRSERSDGVKAYYALLLEWLAVDDSIRERRC